MEIFPILPYNKTVAIMINTLNETHLHKTLKEIYLAQNPQSRSEVDISKEKSFQTKDTAAPRKYICDIITKEENVIEIQTANLAHLLPKILLMISLKKKITVVYPLVTVKYIETFQIQQPPAKSKTKQQTTAKKLARQALDPVTEYGTFEYSSQQPNVTSKTENTILKSRRKSPSRKTLYSSLKELTALCPVLLNRYFYLEILEITETEERLLNNEPVQSKNKRRRFRKNWIKQGKRLENIQQTHIFHGKKSWLSILPQNLPEEFTVNQMYQSFIQQNIKIQKTEASLIAWIYSRSGIFEKTGKQGNSYIYRIK